MVSGYDLPAGKITFEEISNLWSCSAFNETGEDLPLRTFHNHRQAIEEMFDIIIECDKHDGYTYFIEKRKEQNTRQPHQYHFVIA